MKNIQLFYLEHCPYCVHARRAVGELLKENPAYARIGIRWIEEGREAELAGQYDYYYVPTIFFEGRKLYEARPSQGYESIKESIRGAFDQVLS